MAKSYRDCLEELLVESRNRIEDKHPDLHWDEVAREVVEDHVFRTYDSETLENILNNSRPNDEWQHHCSDMSNFEQVKKAMAFTAMRTDILQELENEFE